MNEFWWATLVFIVMGLTPFLLASVNNARERGEVRGREEGRR